MIKNNGTKEQERNIETETFSVVILHYNQQNYINEALDSVFAQDYGNIELIIADDASPGLDIESIQSYIETYRTPQIANVKYQLLETNEGTVRNINQALKAASGKYGMFFAADDGLYDSHVLTSFAKALSIMPPDQYMVSAQCAMMDERLEERILDFVNVQTALNMNRVSSIEQYQKNALRCLYASGATAFRMTMLKDKGYFDETYKIIEDWSYYLKLTLNGSRIIYFDFYALKHRDGGVSHFNQEELPLHVIEYKNDSLSIQEKQILPYLSSFSLADQVLLMNRYDWERDSFAKLFTNKKRPSRVSIIKQHKKFYTYKLVWWMMDHTVCYMKRCVNWAKRLLPTWVILRIIKIVGLALVPNGQLMFINTQAYNLLTSAVLILLIADLIAFTGLALLSVLFYLRKKWKSLFSKNQ